MSTLASDIRYGVRQLWQNPGFTLVMVLVLSLGISVSIALFGYVEWRLHPPSPFSGPQQVVHLSATNQTMDREDLSYLDFLALRKQLTCLSGLAAVRYGSAILKKDQWSREYETAEVSRNFFSVAQVQATRGTVFSEGDNEELRRQPGVVLSHRLWESQFGSDPNIIGRSILVDDVPRVVWGIAPRGFHSVAYHFEQGPTVDFWIPVDSGDDPEDATYEELLGRLRPGVSLQTLRVETESAFQRLELRDPDTLAPLIPLILSDRAYRQAESYPAPAFLGIGVGCAILLIACLNVSGSLLARTEVRRAEMAVRQALGAGRVRLMRQLLVEGALFAGLALGVSLVVSYWLMSLLLSSSEVALGRVHCLNPRVAFFSLSITLAGILLFEFLPIWHTCRTSPITALRVDPSDGSRAGRRRRGFSALVVLQLALTLILTYGAGLLLRSYLRAGAVESGSQRRNVLLAHLEPRGDAGRSQVFFRDLVTHVRMLSGVRNVGLGLWAPMDDPRGRTEYEVSLPGDSTLETGRRQMIGANIVTPGYFPAAGLPILRGRNFSEPGSRQNSREVIIDEAFASRFWPNQDPVGRLVQLVDCEDDHAVPEAARIVGLVRNMKSHETGATAEPYLYIPWGQAFSDEMTLLVETQGEARLWADPVREIIERLDSRVPVYPMTTLAEKAQNRLRGHASDARLFGLLSLIGMSLAGIGLYGIIAFAVTRRTHELGVRMALGARSRDVVGLVMGQGLKLSLIGLGLGLIGSYILSRVLWASLFGAGLFDPVAFAGSALVLIGAALLACYFPARRAARVDPMVALRCE